MRMRNLLRLRKVLKDPKSSKKLAQEINKEVAENKRQYEQRDKELNDLLKIIESAQSIINTKTQE